MEILKKSAYFVLLSGTVGLLVNEFIFHWGRIATLFFASISLLGFSIFGVILLLEKFIQDDFYL